MASIFFQPVILVWLYPSNIYAGLLHYIICLYIIPSVLWCNKAFWVLNAIQQDWTIIVRQTQNRFANFLGHNIHSANITLASEFWPVDIVWINDAEIGKLVLLQLCLLIYECILSTTGQRFFIEVNYISCIVPSTAHFHSWKSGQIWNWNQNFSFVTGSKLTIIKLCKHVLYVVSD